MHTKPAVQADDRRAEKGFTLVEALVAIVILVFGLIAIANLFAIAAGSNSVANQSTAAAAQAAAAMDRLRSKSFQDLAAGGSLTGTTCTTGAYSSCDAVPGVGSVFTQWQITSIDANTLFITVRSEGTGVLSRQRSRAEFTEFRTCTSVVNGCSL